MTIREGARGVGLAVSALLALGYAGHQVAALAHGNYSGYLTLFIAVAALLWYGFYRNRRLLAAIAWLFFAVQFFNVGLFALPLVGVIFVCLLIPPPPRIRRREAED